MPDSNMQGWGSLQYGKSVAGTPLSIAGRTFTSGLGTHANSRIVYALEPGTESFSAWVGVDDNLKQHPEAPEASVVFRVTGDGKVLFDSGLMRMGDPPRHVDVPLAGISELGLIVTDAADGINCDHADWADAKFVGTSRSTPQLTPAYQIKSGGITANLDKSGNLTHLRVGNAAMAWPVSGGTSLPGLTLQGEVSATQRDGTCVFSRTMRDRHGHTCSVTDRYIADDACIRWEIEITSPDAPWSAPIRSWLNCARPEERLIWTAWGSPDFSGTQLTPELAALVQAGKATASGNWTDPLQPAAFPNRSWHYGNVAQNCPVGADFLSLPLITLLDPATDTGLSLVLSPEDVLLDLDLAVSGSGQIRWTRAKHRLGSGKPVKSTMYLVPHEASWRGGLRFLTKRHAEFFEAPNPRVHQLAGCGAYSICEAPVDAAKLHHMAFGFNWKLSDDFPYMGMFIPPVKDADEVWTRSCDEPCPPGKAKTTSCRQMNDYAKAMKQNGFGVLNYFNVTEFGKNMNGRQPVAKADDPDLWKDPAAYLKYRLPNAVFDPGILTCYQASVTDPGDPDYLKFILEQATRHNTMLPATDGICIDRADWLRLYNTRADDGVSWVNNGPARSLFRSWADLMSQLGPLMHHADKVIFSNMMTMRLELCRELDGIYTEFGNNGNALNTSALLGIRKPVVAWTYNQTLREPDPDSFMQRHLHLGVFPTAPYPYNNHCITPEPAADRLYQDYGPLLNAMRGRKWVLAPHCVETGTPGAKVNLFETRGGYVLPVTFGGTAETATVRIRNLPDMDTWSATVIHPGQGPATKPAAQLDNDDLTLTIPLKRGCAMVVLTPGK